MGKVYGGRWEVISSLGKGGQGEVFEVRNRLEVSPERFALKRVLNPKRQKRFEAEVLAIKRLSHPNIVRLIDHSAFTSDEEAPEKQFIVMPFASGGDLTTRVKVYKDSIDSVVSIAGALASALSAAHKGGIIHRDVKPANILFADEGNTPWLADFGICLIRDMDRNTATREVAGPWAFMAPETERGGPLEVTAAADIYSLGKLIFYMVSGGIVLPREDLDHDRYSEVLSKGGRFHLLDLMLRRMICKREARMQAMEEVENNIRRIAEWDKTSISSPFKESAIDRIQNIQRSILEKRQKEYTRRTEFEDNEALALAVRNQIHDFVRDDLLRAAETIDGGDVITTSIREVISEELGFTQFRELRAEVGHELILGNIETEGAALIIQFLICRERKNRVLFRKLGDSAVLEPPPEPVIYTILPRVMKRHRRGSYAGRKPVFFIGKGGRLFGTPESPQQTAQFGARTPSLESSNTGESGKMFAVELASSGWPSTGNNLKEFVGLVLESFIEVFERSRDSPFLM